MPAKRIDPISFINRLTHAKGRDWGGKPFDLRPWQKRDIKKIFVRDKNRKRRYRTVLYMLPRKNGKTEIAAAIGLYMLLADGEVGGEVYCAAADRDQASLVFGAAVQMLRNDAELLGMVDIVESQKRIVHRPSGSFMRAVSAEAYSKHGFGASCVIYDELHAAPNRELWDVLTTSTGARSEPLVIAISTAGFDRNSILYELYAHGQAVNEGVVSDPSFLSIVYEAGPEDDWTDEAVWKKANPALGDFRSLEEMREKFQRAQSIPAQQNAFRRLYLNQWCMTKGTLVLMATGERIPVESVCVGDYVVAFDESSGKLSHAQVLVAAPNGDREVYRISTARGRTLTVTGNHRMWTKHGWVRADEMSPGLHVAVAHSWKTKDGGQRLHPDTAYVLGVMVGDGTCRRNPRLTTVNREIVDASNGVMRGHGREFAPLSDGVHWYVRHLTPGVTTKSTWMTRTLKKHGLFGSTSKTKRVPRRVFTGGPNSWAKFLSGYLDTDGHVAERSVIWVSISRDLLQDCQDLLAGLGVQSTIRRSPQVQTAYGLCRTFRLEVHHASGLNRLAQLLTPMHDVKATRLSRLRGLKGDPVETTFWDRVVEVDRLNDPVPTYGLEVETHHTHVTNGLISHNTETDERWVDMAVWDACNAMPDLEALRGRPCYGGLDLASTRDVTAFVLAFPDEDDPEYVDVLPFFWVPGDSLRERVLKDRVPYDEWERHGWLRITEGNVCDYDRVREDVRELAEMYEIQEIAYDRWGATQLITQLESDGATCSPLGQGYSSLSAPTKELDKKIAGQKIRHGGQPVLRWMASNVAIEQDSAGNIKPSKRRSREKIDGIVALVMAMDRLTRYLHEPSVYDTDEIFVV